MSANVAGSREDQHGEAEFEVAEAASARSPASGDIASSAANGFRIRWVRRDERAGKQV